jgi:hypothetical protein
MASQQVDARQGREDMMARSDYAHWNEEQDIVWWQEEGRHQDDPNDDESWRDEPEPDEEEDE